MDIVARLLISCCSYRLSQPGRLLRARTPEAHPRSSTVRLHWQVRKPILNGRSVSRGDDVEWVSVGRAPGRHTGNPRAPTEREPADRSTGPTRSRGPRWDRVKCSTTQSPAHNAASTADQEKISTFDDRPFTSTGVTEEEAVTGPQ